MKRIKVCFFVFLFLVLILQHQLSWSQVTMQGRVTEKGTGEPLPGATVFIPDLKTGAAADKDGHYRITNLPKAKLIVQVSYVGYKSVTQLIDLNSLGEKDFELAESAIEAQEVVVTGNALSSDNSRSSISITPITKSQLLAIPSTNIIDAISTVPGLSEITTGGEISKPVIRGMSYNHVVTLSDGVRQEGSQWGDEHGIEIDQFSADRIEVLKGPASLFYGSDAMGGVINILEPLPTPMGNVRGEAISEFSVNERLFSNSLMLEGNHNGYLWRIRGTYKNAAAYKTPPEYIFNSGFRENNYNLLLGANKKWGYSHLHASIFDTKIGMADGTRDSLTGQFIDYLGNVISPEKAKNRTIEVPFQKVQHYKISSVNNFIFGNHQLKVDIGFQTNDRREYASTPDQPGLFLQLSTLTYNARYTLSLKNSLELVAGFSGMTQQNRNKGVEFLVPDYDLQDLGGFVYSKKSWERFTFNIGIRYDYRHITGKALYVDNLGHPAPAGDTLFPSFKSDFYAITGSAGMTFRLSKVFNFKFNIGRGFRAPNIAELASNGVHEGTLRYEIGNPALKSETSIQFDGEISANTDLLSASFNGFYNVIDNYIYYKNIDNEKKFVNNQWYPVYRYVQGNSVLKGFEFEFDIHPLDALHFDNNIDYVWGENISSSTPLPYIPALHLTDEIKWTFKTKKQSHFKSPYIGIQLETHFRQGRIDTFETVTPGYVLLNASLGTNLKVQNQLWALFISGKNLTDQTYYDHLSRLKDLGIHNMGWNVTFGLIIPFGLCDAAKKPAS